MASLQVQGHSTWLLMLSPRGRARVVAEMVRRQYQGRYPWGGLGAETSAYLTLQMPDGHLWRLRPFEGAEPPPRDDLWARARAGWTGLQTASWPRRLVVGFALVLRVVWKPAAEAWLRFVSPLAHRWTELRYAFGRTSTWARWEPEEALAPLLLSAHEEKL